MKLLFLKPKTITVKVGIIEENHFFISMNLERLEFGLPEFARLVLHYYAKILYILDPADKESALSASAMFHMMDKVIEKPIARYSNILEIADINDVMEVSIGQPENPHCRMVAKLYYIDQMHRAIKTWFRGNIYQQQVVFSLFALLQEAVNRCDPACIDILRRSLMFMNTLYGQGHNYSDISSLYEIPNRAYLGTVFAEMEERFKSKQNDSLG